MGKVIGDLVRKAFEVDWQEPGEVKNGVPLLDCNRNATLIPTLELVNEIRDGMDSSEGEE